MPDFGRRVLHMHRPLKRQLFVGSSANDFGHRKTDGLKIKIGERVGQSPQLRRCSQVKECETRTSRVKDPPMHLVRQTLRRHVAQIPIPVSQQRSNSLAAPWQHIHRIFRRLLPRRATRQERTLIRTQAVRTDDDAGHPIARHDLLKLQGPCRSLRQIPPHGLRDIRFDQQSLEVARPPQNKLIVHMPDEHPTDGNFRTLQHQRLKRRIRQMRLLDLRRCFHLDEFKLSARPPQDICNDREIPCPKRRLIERGRRTTALRQNPLGLRNGRRHAALARDHDARLQPLHHLVERLTLKYLNVRFSRVLDRLMNVKPQPLVTLEPR